MAERDDYEDRDLRPSPAAWVQARAAAIGYGMVVILVAYFIAAVVVYLLTPAR